MSLVEAQGLKITGHAADVAVQGMLRGVRDATGAFLLGPGQANNPGTQSLYGYPIDFEPFPVAMTDDFITGAWNNLVIGVRQDIRFEMSTDFVIADATGKVLVSGFQDNQTALKVWARYGAAILHPVTRAHPAGALPFAKADLAAVTGGGNGGLGLGEEVADARRSARHLRRRPACRGRCPGLDVVGHPRR